MSHCCEQKPACHQEQTVKPDWLLRSTLGSAVVLYLWHWLAMGWLGQPLWLQTLSHSVVELVNTLWWGLLLAAVFVGLLDRIPQAWVMSVLGRGERFSGIARATFAGVLLDLCSHGILMVGMKLYQRGASLGQVMAFLVASPWNSLSLTIILWALIGWQWTLVFIALSMLIGLITGCLVNLLTARGYLPENPHTQAAAEDTRSFKQVVAEARWTPSALAELLWDGLKGSRMVLRWVFLGVLLASLIRAFVPLELFQTWFGATGLGLAMTLVAATIIEVCSEGSTPIAADIFNRAGARGNSFAFLMAGVSTDYTEIMSIKDTTKSWKVALVLPLLTLPQIIIIAACLNAIG